MKLPIFQVDAFARRIFEGNPAAVVVLEQPLKESTMQSIAAENNLSETAFVILGDSPLTLRWFTPSVEVDLCGHATLATAYILFRHQLITEETVEFLTKSGLLRVRKSGDLLSLDFPSRPPVKIELEEGLEKALGVRPVEAHASRDWLVLFGSEEDVAALKPDFGLIRRLDTFAVIATAPGEDVDFVSRFFAPKAGVDEDPVTGSAHCTLTPFWARRLGKSKLRARQISNRKGEVICEDCGDRVSISGYAVEYLAGQIEVVEEDE
jgi:PhzF family phenazine biosynthesis protein